VTNKLKIFIWLIFRDRINSRNLLKRKKYKIEGDDYSCVLCNLDIEEYTYHLLFLWPFSEQCWDFLAIHWDHDLYFFDTIMKAKGQCHHEFFMEVFTIVAWEIWKQRNELIFKVPWKVNFSSSIKQQLYRLNQDSRSKILSCLSTN
jgi:hypothetical protein